MARPQPSPYRPDPAILALGGDFYDPVQTPAFPKTILRFRNQDWAAAIGLGDLDDADWLRHFAVFAPLPDNLTQPLALRYHGHQFRSYNPDIGDGRGFLFAQLRDGGGRLLDLGTKGSGQTPYSRFGDGRLTLKGGVREVLATEMLEALGADTSKSFSLIETGESLERNDEPSPTRSAVLVRLQHSHVRIGTFQRFAFFEDRDSLARLTAFCLGQYYGEDGGSDPAARLVELAAAACGRLAASYIAAGFVHGVLNSDNIAITAQSFDYGPWRFTPFWDGRFTAAYFDQTGLYAFGRQPEAIHWNVLQLALALRELSSEAAMEAALAAFAPAFHAALVEKMLARLGVLPLGDEESRRLVAAIEVALVPKAVEIDRFFFDWRGGTLRGPGTLYEGEAWQDFRKLIGAYRPREGACDHPYWADAAPCSMHIEEVEAIWDDIAAQDDWSRFDAKVAAIRRMGAALAAPRLTNSGEEA